MTFRFTVPDGLLTRNTAVLLALTAFVWVGTPFAPAQPPLTPETSAGTSDEPASDGQPISIAQPGGAAPATQPTGPGPNPAAGPDGAPAAADGPRDPEEGKRIIEEFKNQAPPDVYKAGMEALQEFDEKAAAFTKAMIGMRGQHILVVNGYKEDKQQYIDFRNTARIQMNETYRAALRLVEYFPYPDAMRFLVTVIEHRVKLGVYDVETLEGAAKLLDYGVRLRYVAQAAARAGMVSGDFDLSKRIYEQMKDEELEEIDKRLIGQAEEVKRQFEVEKELLANDSGDLPKVLFKTTKGDFVVTLFVDEAPSTVSHFISLVESGFYDGLDFFQVVSDMLAMTGDPLGDGSTRPDRYLADENGREVVRMPIRGSLVMSKLPQGNKDFVPNSAGTQFAILFMPFPAVIAKQTVFGRVTEGLEVLASLRRLDPTKKKEKNEILAPPDRIIECEVINRPEKLPEVFYADPIAAPMPQGPMPSGPAAGPAPAP